MDQSEPGTGMYDVQELLRRWEYGELTTEQMIGQLLLRLLALNGAWKRWKTKNSVQVSGVQVLNT